MHAFQRIAEEGVRRRRVLDFAKVVERQFQRRLDAVIQIADVVMPIDREFRQLRVRAGVADPDRFALLRHLEMLGTGIELGRRGAFAFTLGVKRPAVIAALELVVADFAQAQLHAAMRTLVIESADIAFGVAELNQVVPGQTHAGHGVFLSCRLGKIGCQ